MSKKPHNPLLEAHQSFAADLGGWQGERHLAAVAWLRDGESMDPQEVHDYMQVLGCFYSTERAEGVDPVLAGYMKTIPDAVDPASDARTPPWLLDRLADYDEEAVRQCVANNRNTVTSIPVSGWPLPKALAAGRRSER